MYRVINENSREVLSLNPIDTIDEARVVSGEAESDESQPEVEIQENVNGEWVKVN